MIRRKRADTWVYRLWCDECGAEMRPSGSALPTDPPQFPHACTNKECNSTFISTGRIYPIVDTVETHEEVMTDTEAELNEMTKQ